MSEILEIQQLRDSLWAQLKPRKEDDELVSLDMWVDWVHINYNGMFGNLSW